MCDEVEPCRSLCDLSHTWCAAVGLIPLGLELHEAFPERTAGAGLDISPGPHDGAHRSLRSKIQMSNGHHGLRSAELGSGLETTYIHSDKGVCVDQSLWKFI